MTRHEEHGYCRNCRYKAHRYPYGWDHVNCGVYACQELEPVITCCERHALLRSA